MTPVEVVGAVLTVIAGGLGICGLVVSVASLIPERF